MFGMVRGVRSWADYILETERHLFRKMSGRDPKHNSDHYLILGCLRSAILREHENCLWRRTRLSICNPTTLTREGGLFVSLRWTIPKTKSQEGRNNTWRLVKTRVYMRQDPERNQGLLQCLSRQIAAILKEDWHQRVETSRGNMEDLLTSVPPSQGSMEQDGGVVQGCIRLRVNACLTQYQSDHGSAGRAASPFTTTRGEHPHIC